MDDVKLKARGGEWPGHSRLEGISARIIMTHTQSIINLACIIRKHESGHVVKVLLVVPLSSLWPRRPSVIFFFFPTAGHLQKEHSSVWRLDSSHIVFMSNHG